MNTKWTRREFIKAAGASAFSALAASYPRLSIASDYGSTEKLEATADAVIFLWMAGGMAHTETFDPKPRTDFQKGIDSRKVLSTYDTIDTVVDNIKLSEGLEKIGSVIDRGTIVRSAHSADLGPILHTRHQFHWHTGYVPPLTVAAPHIGAMIARTLGPKNPDIPAFIETGQRIEGDGAEEIKAFMNAGFLGSEYAPFRIPYPEQGAERISPPPGMSTARFNLRFKHFKKLAEQNPAWNGAGDYQRESIIRSMESAHRLMTSPAAKAFNINDEPREVFDAYNTGRFGQGCLLARRLVEAGARFVEVSTEYKAFGNWDTHNSGHARTLDLKRSIDAPIAQLVLDLEERGLLNRTLIVLASEFSRVAGQNPGKNNRATDIVINNQRQFGLHRHFTDGGCVVMFGGGVKGGYLHGSTADEFPCNAVDRSVSVEEVHATIYRALGIPANLSYEIEKRPFYVTRDGLGKPIAEVFERSIV